MWLLELIRYLAEMFLHIMSNILYSLDCFQCLIVPCPLDATKSWQSLSLVDNQGVLLHAEGNKDIV